MHSHPSDPSPAAGSAHRRVRLPRSPRAEQAWQLALAMPLGVQDPQFRALVRQLDGSRWHALEDVSLHEDGQATFDAIAEAILAARSEILLETYILRDDAVGTRVCELLCAAVARGIRVYVLADALGSVATSRRFWRSLTDAGVALRLFHPWWHSPLHAWRRDHRKMIVIDRQLAFTGGMNIGNEYGSSLRRTSYASTLGFRDLFVELTGAVAAELAMVFAEGWQRAGGEAIEALAPIADRSRFDPAVPPPDSGVLILDARPGRGQPETIAVLSALVGAARHTLWITTPYFAPPDTGLTFLEGAARRGVDVRLMLPGISDVPIVRHAAHGVYARLLDAGVRIFEYERAVLHTKSIVCDGALTMIGSSNLDFRSLWFNAECNLMLADSEIAAQMEAVFLADLRDATEMDARLWARRSRWHRLGDTIARGLRVLL